jgi:hypothetical protein
LPAIQACTVLSFKICASNKDETLYLFSRWGSSHGEQVRINPVQTIRLRPANRLLAEWQRLKAKLRNWHEAAGFNAESRIVHLHSNEVMCLTKVSGCRQVEVRSGTIWLTGTPAKGDVLLRPGEQLHLTHGWPFVLQAVNEAQIVLRS